MNVILLSGGAGKRLWPLSDDIRSKQFLQLLSSPDGRKESMIQRVVRQIKLTGLSEDITVMTGKQQQKIMEDQVGNDLTIVTEPERRDTFPAIYLACSYLLSKGIGLNESVVILPCDSYTTDDYFAFIKRLDSAIQTDVADIIMVGIIPTYPATKYGYILPEHKEISENEITPIVRFIEKPREPEAEVLIQKGALWNAGAYGFKLGYLLNSGDKIFGSQDFDTLIRNYGNLPKLSFSYEVLEKANRAAVIAYSGEWKDVGTWNALTEVLQKNEYGQVYTSECNDTYIINELNIPLACIGCEDMIIVASDNGILVISHDKSEQIKEIVNKTNLVDKQS